MRKQRAGKQIIERLESRHLLSGSIPLSGSDPTLQAVVLQGESYRPYVYPDTGGHPTVGIGINLDAASPSWFTGAGITNGVDSGTTLAAANAAWADELTKFLAIPGNSTADFTKKTYVKGKAHYYQTEWNAFINADPSPFTSTDLIFGDAATNLVAPAAAVTVVSNVLNSFIDSVRGFSEWDGKFDALATSTQIALIDVAYNKGVTGLRRLGDSTGLFDDLIDDDIPSAQDDLSQATGMVASRLAADVAMLAPAPTATFTIPADGSTNDLTGISRGDVVVIQANFSTTDENEDGEGESLPISSSTDFSQTDSNYNACTVYNFTVADPTTVPESASADVSLTANPENWDGDESADITATFSINGDPSTSPAQQSAFSNVASDMDTAATGLATIANSLESSVSSGGNSYDSGAENAAWSSAALQCVGSADFNSLSLDPPDSKYEVIVRPSKVSTAILSKTKEFKGLKNAGPLTASINALEINQERSINLAAAAYATANKLDGAIAANNKVWTKRQTSTLKSYERMLAGLLASQPALANREAAALNKSMLGGTAVASTDVNSFEEQVNDDGLPAQFTTDLNELGVSPTTQSQIQQALFAQDIDTASGTYSSILTDSSLEAELKEVAALLKAR